jgi:hypothetical protein
MNSGFFFALGLGLGTLLCAGNMWRAFRSGEKLAKALLAWLAVSYGLGTVACIPNLLRLLGTPEPICTHPAMNIFFLHSWIEHRHAGGNIIGNALTAGWVMLQYTTLLSAVFRINWLIKHREPREHV